MSNEPFASLSWNDVRRLAEEVRVKVHLAGMDLKDRWKDLEPELHDFEEKVRAAGEKAEATLSAQAEAIGAGVRKFAQELRDSLQKK
ncbi:MAG TPA: hypothetical protein PKU97_17295 [Kofleriaceae bacterium]|jgi:hypothetical protein|nr:hypothetical protein [Kofleriaceae bacterium]